MYMPSNSPITAPPSTQLTKKERKLMTRKQLELKGSQEQQLISQQLSRSGLIHLYKEPVTMGSDFEALGVVLLVMGVGLAVHFSMGPLMGLQQDFLVLCMGLVIIAYAMWLALRSEFSFERTVLQQLGGKLHLAVLFLAGAVGTMAVLTVAAPQGWVTFDVYRASQDLHQLIVWLIKKRKLDLEPPQPLDPTSLAIALSILGGCTSAALWAPVSRIARLYNQHSPVPYWGAEYLALGPLATSIVQLALALPAAVVVMWLPPMTSLWGAVPLQLPPLLLGVTAICQVLAVRPLTQLHLNGGLLEWHLLRHDGSSAPSKAKIVEMRLRLVYAMTCKAALQVLIPAAILTCSTVAYMSASGNLVAWLPSQPLLIQPWLTRLTSSPPIGAAAAGNAPSAAAPLGFVTFVAAFMAWWTCVVQCCFAYPVLLVYRSGMHISG